MSLTTHSVKGFTLVEMLLYVLICSTLLLALATSLSFLLGARIKNQTITEVNQDGIQVMQLMTQTIRNAKSINTPVLASSSSVLSIKTVSSSYDPTLFTLASGTLSIKEGSGVSVPITNSKIIVSSLLFNNTSASSTDGGSVEINFTLSYATTSGRNEYSYSKTFMGSASFH